MDIKEKVLMILLAGLLGGAIDMSGLQALAQLFYAIMPIGILVGIALVLLALFDRLTGGTIRAIFGKLL